MRAASICETGLCDVWRKHNRTDAVSAVGAVSRFKRKKEERYVFVTTAVFLAFTVYNPFAVKYILGKLGMVNVYYRFSGFCRWY